MAFDIPRETHRFLIEEISESIHPKVMLVKRFMKFHETLQKTKKFGVRYLCELSSNNMMTAYGQNLRNTTWMSDKVVRSTNVINIIKYAPVPDNEKWKISVIKDLLEVKWNFSEI